MRLEDEYYCPNCNATLNNQLGFAPDCDIWTCTECGTTLYGDDVEETMEQYEGVVWYCDSCGDVLNRQLGFYDYCETWYCTKCGNANPINEDQIYESEKEYQSQMTTYECPSCGAILNHQSNFYEDDTYTCFSCYACLEKNNNKYELMYVCPVCESNLNEQWDFNEDDKWTCKICGEKLYKDDSHYEISFDNIENESDDKFNKNDCLHKSKKYNFVDSYEACESEKSTSYKSTKKSRLKRKMQWKTKNSPRSAYDCIISHRIL